MLVFYHCLGIAGDEDDLKRKGDWLVALSKYVNYFRGLIKNHQIPRQISIPNADVAANTRTKTGMIGAMPSIRLRNRPAKGAARMPTQPARQS